MATKSFSVKEILDIAMHVYAESLMEQIRDANNNYLAYTRHKLNQGNPELKVEDMEWYFCDEHDIHNHSKRIPDLNAYIIETLKNVSPKFKERYEAKC